MLFLAKNTLTSSLVFVETNNVNARVINCNLVKITLLLIKMFKLKYFYFL